MSQNVVGIAENTPTNQITVYSNPGDGNFTIDLGSKYDRIKVTISDIN